MRRFSQNEGGTVIGVLQFARILAGIETRGTALPRSRARRGGDGARPQRILYKALE